MYVIATGRVAVVMKNPFIFGMGQSMLIRSPMLMSRSPLLISRSPLLLKTTRSPKSIYVGSPINNQVISPKNINFSMSRNRQQSFKLNM